MVYVRLWSDVWNPVKKDAPECPITNDNQEVGVIAPPKTDTPSDSPIREPVSVYFSPGKDPEENIIGFIQRTSETLDIAVFAFTSREIMKEVQRAKARGVKIRILMDAGQAGMSTSVYPLLSPVLGNSFALDKSSYQQHNKFAIADGKAVITGSYNWSNRAINNMENIVILRDTESIKKYQNYFESIWEKNI